MNSLTQKLRDNLEHKQSVFIDPATIMLIVTLTNVLIQVIKKCREKPADAITTVQFPTEREKRLVKRNIRKTVGLKKYWQEGDKYYEAVLATGRETTIQDLEEAYGEMGGRNR